MKKKFMILKIVFSTVPENSGDFNRFGKKQKFKSFGYLLMVDRWSRRT